MKPITREYLLLFNTMTDLEQSLYQLRQRLILAQQQAEELFLEDESALSDERPAAS